MADGHILVPTAQGAGTILSVGGAQPAVGYTGIEDLDLVMQAADGDTVSVRGTANTDTFEVTPGNRPDTGRVAGTFNVGAAAFTLPNITYSGSTAATPAAGGIPAAVGGIGINTGPAATQGGTDTVVYNGTSENDIFTVVNEAVTLQSAAWGGPNTPPILLGAVNATSTTNIVINAGNGDDRINMVSASAGTETYDFNGGNPDSGSDSLAFVDPGAVQNVVISPDPVDPTQQDVAGYSANATPIDVTGFELITYTGAGRNDTLTVTPNSDDDVIRVQNQSVTAGTASVTSQTLPEIHFTGLSTFLIDRLVAGTPNLGAIVATFVTQNLDPATGYGYQAGSEDVLVIEGAESFPDNYVVFNPVNLGVASGFPTVVDMSTAPGPVVTIASNFATGPAPGFRPGEIRFDTKGGDDTVTIDTGGGGGTAGAVFPVSLNAANAVARDLVDTRIVYDGGTGGDVLNVIGAPIDGCGQRGVHGRL